MSYSAAELVKIPREVFQSEKWGLPFLFRPKRIAINTFFKVTLTIIACVYTQIVRNRWLYPSFSRTTLYTKEQKTGTAIPVSQSACCQKSLIFALHTQYRHKTRANKLKQVAVSRFLRTTLCAIAVLISLAFFAGCSSEKQIAEVGMKAPDFRLETLDHQRFYLNQHEGEVVVMSFWASWCTICRQELVELQKLSEEYSEKGVTIVSILTDPEELVAAQQIVDGLKLTLPVLLDRDGTVAKNYGVAVVPVTVVIGKDGKVALAHTGYDSTSLKQIKNTIASSIGGTK